MLKKYVLGSLLVVFSVTTKANDKSGSSEPNEVSEKKGYFSLTEDIQEFAKKLIGIRYRWGGRALKGFDCSGLVNYVFAKFGMQVAHRSSELYKLGCQTSLEEAMPGDLIFFKINPKRGEVSHVGIILEPDENGMRFIHSSRTTGVCISYLKEKYYTTHFAGVRRVIDSLKESKN